MYEYLRIPKNKFWAWVFTSLTVGLLIGVVATYAVSRTSSSRQIDDLKKQLGMQASQAASTTSSLQTRLDSAEASLSATNDKYTTLQAQNTASNSSSTKGSASTTSQTVTLEVLQRKVSPSSVATGDNITLSAKVQGHPDRVTMRILDSAIGYDETFPLSRKSRTSTTETWSSTISAPKKKGTYRYFATAYLNGKSATMPGASASSFKVH